MSPNNECNELANPDTNIAPLVPPTCNLQPATCAPPLEPSTCNSSPSWLAHRGNGKVARLPKAAREQINQWILEGVPYSDIIQRLGHQGKDLKPDNLSQWKKRGHQDWLLQQAWLSEIRARQEPASDLSLDFDASQLNHAALQLGTLQMFEVLRDLTHHSNSDLSADSDGATPLPPMDSPDVPPSPGLPAEPALAKAGADGRAETEPADADEPQPASRHISILDRRLGGDSTAFVRLMNALVRASRETMLVQKYREACARARDTLRQLDLNRELDEDETRAIVRRVDKILGIPSQPDDPPPRRDQLSESASIKPSEARAP